MPANPLLPKEIDLARARRFALTLSDGDGAALAINGETLADWSAKPQFAVRRGAAVTLALINATATTRTMRLGGHVARLLHALDDGWEPYWRDVFIVPPGRTVRLAFVADNPGTAVNVCDLAPGSTVARTFVTFEHDAATYLTQYPGNIIDGSGGYSAGEQYPAGTFWHLVYGASSSQMPQIVSLAAARHAGYVYATDGALPNPWDTGASYLTAEARAAAAGRVAARGPALLTGPVGALAPG